MAVSGKSGEVSGETAESWKENIPESLQGYIAKKFGIWTKQVSFRRPYSTKSLDKKQKSCEGGKRFTQKLTVAFFMNTAGSKEGIKPIIIWKSKSPCCFNRLDKSQLR